MLVPTANLDIWLRGLPDRDLVDLRSAVDAEMERRDVCEHGVPTGNWCDACLREYRRAWAEAEHEGP